MPLGSGVEEHDDEKKSMSKKEGKKREGAEDCHQDRQLQRLIT